MPLPIYVGRGVGVRSKSCRQHVRFVVSRVLCPIAGRVLRSFLVSSDDVSSVSATLHASQRIHQRHELYSPMVPFRTIFEHHRDQHGKENGRVESLTQCQRWR